MKNQNMKPVIAQLKVVIKQELLAEAVDQAPNKIENSMLVVAPIAISKDESKIFIPATLRYKAENFPWNSMLRYGFIFTKEGDDYIISERIDLTSLGLSIDDVTSTKINNEGTVTSLLRIWANQVSSYEFIKQDDEWETEQSALTINDYYDQKHRASILPDPHPGQLLVQSSMDKEELLEAASSMGLSLAHEDSNGSLVFTAHESLMPMMNRKHFVMVVKLVK